MKKLFRSVLGISALLLTLLTISGFTSSSTHAASLSTTKASHNAACGGWLDQDSNAKYLLHGFYGEAHLQQLSGCNIARGMGCFTSPSNNNNADVVVYVINYVNGNYTSTQRDDVIIPLHRSVRVCFGGASYSFSPGASITIDAQFSDNVDNYLGAIGIVGTLY